MRLKEVKVWVDGFKLSMFAKSEIRHRVIIYSQLLLKLL